LRAEIAAHLSGARNDKKSLMNQATTKMRGLTLLLKRDFIVFVAYYVGG
jgi:hypothetical protein